MKLIGNKITGLLVFGSLLALVATSSLISAQTSSTPASPPAAQKDGGGPQSDPQTATEPATQAETPASETQAPQTAEPETTAPAAPVSAQKPAPATTPPADTPPADTPPAATPRVAEPAPAPAPAPAAKVTQVYAPQNDLERDVLGVLAKHCARCHQDGALTELDKPAKDFGNVMHLREIAATPALVQPGNPDGSKLFTQITNREMPYDLFNEFDETKPEPTPQDILTLRKWINSLGDTAAAACKAREFIDNAAVVKLISDDLNSLQPHRLRGTRYITLTNLYNGCLADGDLKVYRQGVVKLLNSLSTNSDVIKMETIDKAQTIIRFHLDDVKWTEAQWNRIIAIYPYASRPDSNLYKFLETTTYTPVPYIRGDWFAFTASRPPLYHDLLNMPNRFGKLTRALGVDLKHNIAKYIAQRAGFQKSGVSVHNRLIERHTISTGFFWTSYDFAGSRGRQSLFDFPLGPGGKYGFKEDGGESIFSLPNGFQAYYLNTEKGLRLDKGPISIVRDPSRRDQSVTNGISCFGCHDQGVRKAKDDIRAHVLGDRSLPKSVRDAIEALHPTHEVMDKILVDDRARFQNAMKKAGLQPTLKLNGVEMINALSNRYEANVDVNLAGAEFGLDKPGFLQAMVQAGPKAYALKRRLEQGLVPRDQFEGFYRELVPQLIDEEVIRVKIARRQKYVKPARVNAASYKVSHKFDLALYSDKSSYYVNELPVFSVTSKVGCYLSLINVDKTGNATVIFPNKFQRNNLLKAGKTLKFPGRNAPFQFRLKDKGVETVIAVCNAGGKQVDGIKHKFRSAPFTDIGNYNKHLTRQIVVEAVKIKQRKKAPARTKRIKRKKPEIVARTAIKFEVH